MGGQQRGGPHSARTRKDHGRGRVLCTGRAALLAAGVLALVQAQGGDVGAGRPPSFKGLARYKPAAAAGRAKAYVDYCGLCRDHTLCRYAGQGQACEAAALGAGSVSRPPGAEEQDAVVAAHNSMRWLLASGEERRGAPGPQPPAANMRLMWYDEELAAVAQRWADQCQFRHDTCRSVERFPVGQNIYLERASRPLPRPDWYAVAKKWFDEVVQHSGRQTLSPYSFSAVTGHFTQLGWADTFLVGCGVSEYTEYVGGRRWHTRLYVCNYGPTGNVIGDWLYRPGQACSRCPPESYCYYGLCV